MSRIAVVLENFFEDSEFVEPVEALRKDGHDVVVLGLRAEDTVEGKRLGTHVHIDQAISEANPAQFDALLIPGGYSPDRLRAHEEAVDFVASFMAKVKPVFAICHGPQLLITAKHVSGRKLTGWKSIRVDIINAGGEFVDSSVIVDSNLITSRSPKDLPDFIKAIREMLSAT